KLPSRHCAFIANQVSRLKQSLPEFSAPFLRFITRVSQAPELKSQRKCWLRPLRSFRAQASCGRLLRTSSATQLMPCGWADDYACVLPAKVRVMPVNAGFV